MFDINKISRNYLTGQFTCSCNTGSSKTATDIQARYLGPVREKFGFTTEIGIEGSIVTIASNSLDITKWIADQINKGYFMPPLEVYVFYGSSRKGLPARWCIGFNYPDSEQLIDMLNIQNPLVIADKDPQSWVTANGQSYSVILLPGVLEAEPSENLEQKVNLCLQAIQTVTSRKLNPITL